MLNQTNFKFKIHLIVVLPALIILINSYVKSEWTPAGMLTNAGENAVISVYNSNVVWVAGGSIGNPAVFRTTDGGITWINVSTSELGSFPLCAVWGVDENTAYVGNGGSINYGQGNASFYKTTNGGLNWTLMGSTGGTFGFINGIAFSRINPSFGVVQSAPPDGPGSPFWLSVTTDGGVTWNITNAPGVSGAQGFMQTLNVIDEDYYCFGLSGTSPQTGLIKTTNGGQNWSSTTNILGGQFTSGLAISTNKMNGIITSHVNYNIGRTTNGGATWEITNFGGSMSGYLISRFVPNSNVCFIASQNVNSVVKIKMSTNSGETWNSMTTPGVSNILSMDYIKINNEISGYAISENGTILKYTENITSLKKDDNVQPKEFNLGQNYPNPFNPSTNINYELNTAGHVKLAIYNSLGQEVATLVNIFQNAGKYNVKWNASGFTSGVYFYRFETKNNAETKKMILTK